VTALPFFAANFAAPQAAASTAGNALPFAALQQGVAVAGTTNTGFENLVQLFLQGEATPAQVELNPKATLTGKLETATPTIPQPVPTNVSPVAMSTITPPPLIANTETAEPQPNDDEETPEEELPIPAGMMWSVPVPAEVPTVPNPDPPSGNLETEDVYEQMVAPPQNRPALVETPVRAVEATVQEETTPKIQAEQPVTEQPSEAPPEAVDDQPASQVRANNLPDKSGPSHTPVRAKVTNLEGNANEESPSNQAFTLELRSNTATKIDRPDRTQRPQQEQTSEEGAKSQPATESGAKQTTANRTPVEPLKRNDNGTSQQEQHRPPSGSSQTARVQTESVKPSPVDRANAEPTGTSEHASQTSVPASSGPAPISRDSQPTIHQPATPLPTPTSSAQPSAPPVATTTNSTVQQIEALRLAGVQLGFRPQQPVQNLELRVPAAGGSVDVRLIDHGGRIEIAVRSADAGLAQDLRQQLPDLVESLDSHGYTASGADRTRHTEPIENAAQAQRQGQESTYGDQQSSQHQQQQQRRERNSAAAARRAGNRSSVQNDIPAFRIEPGDSQTGAQ